MPVAIRSPMDAVAQSAFKPAQEQHAEHQPRQASEKVSAAPAAPGFSCGFDSSYVSHCGFGGLGFSGFDGAGSASQLDIEHRMSNGQL